MDSLGKARALAVLVPAALLGGAYVSQYGFGLYPCEMCWWQRYPHFAAVGIGLLAYVMKPPQVWTALAGLAILTSGLIGGFHAGVEYGWWEGITACTAPNVASASASARASLATGHACCAIETSAGACGRRPSGFSVAGLITSIVPASPVSIQAPLMNILRVG